MAEEDRAARAMGLLIKRDPDPPIDVWPENKWPAECFARLTKQWQVSHNGAQCLLMPSMVIVMDLLAVPDRPDVFDALLVMESEGLKLFDEQR